MNLLLINELGIVGGGTENRLRTIVDELSRKGVVTHVIQHPRAKQAPTTAIVHTAERSSITQTIRDIVTTHHIDIIQVHKFGGLGKEALIASTSTGVPVVYNAHDHSAICAQQTLFTTRNTTCTGPQLLKCTACSGIRSTLHLRLLAPAFNACAAGVSPSKFIVTQHENAGVLKNKWTVIPPWTDMTRRPVRQPSTPRILFVGSLLPYKGAHIAVSALAHILKQHPDAHLTIVGGTPEHAYIKENIENMARAQGTLSHITFAPYANRETMTKYYHEHNSVVIPSLCQEASGLTLQEALVAGCIPVVSTSGGLPEYCLPELVVPQNDSSALAHTISGLVNNKNIWQQCREFQKKATALFSTKRAAKDYRNLYEKILNSPRL